MPNYCTTEFAIIGDDEGTLLKFYLDMAKGIGYFGGLKETDEPDWFGNLYQSAGYTDEEMKFMHCRGWDVTVDWEIINEKPCVKIGASMAWSPPIDDVHRMITEKYHGDLTVYSLAEEPGCCIFVNDDPTGEYFKERYMIDYTDKDDVCDTIYYAEDEEEALVEMVSKLTGKEWLNAAEILSHESDVQDAFVEQNPGDDCYLNINIFREY